MLTENERFAFLGASKRLFSIVYALIDHINDFLKFKTL